MKNLILILALFLVVDTFGQVTAPSSYTTNYRFRKWVQGANPSADSINANWDLADTKIKLAYDSAQTKGSKVGLNTWSGLNSFNAATSFNATVTSRNILPYTDESYNLGSLSHQWYRGHFNSIRTHQLVIVDPISSDSSFISFDGTQIEFDMPISFTADEILPTNTSKLGNDTSSFNSIFADTITSGESYLFLQGKQGGVEFADVWGVGSPSSKPITAATTTIDCSGLSYIMTTESEVVTGIATLTAGLTRREGSILIVVNANNYNVTFKNGTGNMILGSDVVLGQYDTMTLIYYDIGGSSYRWLKIATETN